MQRPYGNHGSSSFRPSTASVSSGRSTGQWSETPHSYTSSVLLAGVRQLRNAAPPPKDSFLASSAVSSQQKRANSSVVSASVTGSLGRDRFHSLENTACRARSQQPSTSGGMLTRVLPRTQSGPYSGNQGVIQAPGSKRNAEENITEPDLSDNQYKRKVIKLFEEVVAVMKKNNRVHQNADFSIETPILEHFHHFEKVLTSNVKLPLQHYNEVEDLNSALTNNDLSVALCAFYCKTLKTMSSRDQISKMMMSKLFTNSLCSKIL